MHNSNKDKTATVFGATGLVGNVLLRKLIAANYKEVIVVNRRKVGYPDQQLKEMVVEMDKLEEYPELFQTKHIYICLGTTIKKAGSKTNFEEVDLKLPARIAQLANKHGVVKLIMISSLGADASSSNFYLRTKGRAEAAILTDGPEQTFIVRPSMLLGDRNEFRFGENIGKIVMKAIRPLMIGKLKKYRGIHAEKVAEAMVLIMNEPSLKKKIVESDDLLEIATQFRRHEHS
jgi:uncharacterized protein YbjT (DUF2867 family)